VIRRAARREKVWTAVPVSGLAGLILRRGYRHGVIEVLGGHLEAVRTAAQSVLEKRHRGSSENCTVL